jgi:putative transposase
MARSLSHLIVHAVFSTKDRRALLRSEEIRSETYSYMAGILKNLQCHPIKIGGADDHVHILSSLSKNIAFAEMIGRVKGSSSKRLSERGVLGFAWQNGYGAFSVSESSLEAVTAYISDQDEHHRKFSDQEELRELPETPSSPRAEAPWAILFSPFGRPKMSKPAGSMIRSCIANSWIFEPLPRPRVCKPREVDVEALQSDGHRLQVCRAGGSRKTRLK